MSVYDRFRDTVAWRVKLGDEEYPGLPNLGPAQTIPARVQRMTRDVSGDRVSAETVWTLLEHEPKPGDVLNGGTVLEVDAAKDGAGNVLYWIARTTG